MAYWLMKSEPDVFGYADLVRVKREGWDGIRNYEARNFLRAMAKGDRVLFYASVTTKAVLGIAEVSRIAYPDPTATEGDWSVVDLAPFQQLKTPVDLATLKTDSVTQDMPLIRQSRLSVMPLEEGVFRHILELSQTH